MLHYLITPGYYMLFILLKIINNSLDIDTTYELV